MIEEDEVLLVIRKNELLQMIRHCIKEEFKSFKTSLKREPKVPSRDQAAEFIGVSANTISEYVRRGLISNRGHGRRILLLESDLINIPKKNN